MGETWKQAFPFSIFPLTTLASRLTFFAVKINLREIEAGETEFNFQISPEEMDLFLPEVEFPEAVETRVKVTGSEKQHLLDTSVRTKAQCKCSRCLEPVVLPLRAEFKLLLESCGSFAKASETASEAEDLVLVADSDSSFDITERVREAIILSLPLKPLCRENCKGLCPHCGANLNLTTCQCEERKPDPRWNRLKELM